MGPAAATQAEELGQPADREGYYQRAQPFVLIKTAEAVLAKATKHQATSGTLH